MRCLRGQPAARASERVVVRLLSETVLGTVPKFKHWTDADKDGCNTRAEVLLEEAVTAPEVGPKCALTGGSWYSPYDDRYFDSASKLDVDHLVSVAATI